MSLLSTKRAGRRTQENKSRSANLTLIPGKVMEQLLLENISRYMKDFRRSQAHEST